MLKSVRTFLGLSVSEPSRSTQVQRPRFVMTEGCMEALQLSLQPEMRKRHEGIAYLLGVADGSGTLAAAAFRPTAKTSPGSFDVDAAAMATCVRAAARHGLQIVAQVHTHPGAAYHSDGDVEGARIRYPGYASIVLPDYGDRLPTLGGAAAFVFSADAGWVELEVSNIIVVPGFCDG